ncbi:MAG: phage portal protein [Exiguobacterium sp.]|nr:phage portal protein [Exiguobacterium sp.]
MRGKKNIELNARDRPIEKRSLVWYTDNSGFDTLECKGYVSLAHNPEVSTAVDTIARLIGAMTIHLMLNTERGDVRVKNGLSELVDIRPNKLMTRANFIRWIVRTMMLEGNGNAVVYPQSAGGYIDQLVPIPAAYTSFIPYGEFDYRVYIAGREYPPDEVLHFVLNPSDFYPWLGQGYKVTLADVANNLKQAAATEKGFMSSKWKPSLIVKVDALTDEFASPEGRSKLLESYAQSGNAGEPWLIPAEQFDVQQVKPLTLSDLALAEFVKLDKETVASILGVPPFVLGVGEFKRDAWNSFISTTIMPIAQNIQQELTRKLLYSPDYYFRFNPRSLMSYDLKELVDAGAAMVDHAAMRRNEWRDWLGLPPDPDMDDIIVLENYLPIDRLGDQKKLNGEGGENE